MSPLVLSLAGFERVNGIEYTQSWLASPAPPRKASYEELLALRLLVAGATS